MFTTIRTWLEKKASVPFSENSYTTITKGPRGSSVVSIDLNKFRETETQKTSRNQRSGLETRHIKLVQI